MVFLSRRLLLVIICVSAVCSAKCPSEQAQVYDWLKSIYGARGDFPSFSKSNHKKVLEKIFDKAFRLETGIWSHKGLLQGRSSSFSILREGDADSKKNHIKLTQCALFWKGYYQGPFSGRFDKKTVAAVRKLKHDVLGHGTSDTSVDLHWFSAILNESTYVCDKQCDETIREIQQYINRKYRSYCGIVPCDGRYSKRVNKALIRILQHELGCEINGIFDHDLTKKCPTLKPGMRGNLVCLLQSALYLYGFKAKIDGIFGRGLSSSIKSFQNFARLPVTGIADMPTIKALLFSTGDQARPAIACDCAEQLSFEKALNLSRAGYKYVGRYLTGGGWKNIPKYLTKKECAVISKAGLRLFLIYQDGGRKLDYFSAKQGIEDAQKAVSAASALGIPKGSIIYFAVDCDPNNDHLSGSVIPYFKAVSETIGKSRSGYLVGVYGTRKTCISVSDAGYAKMSFVLGLSPLFNGNLGHPLPYNWAFDQFHELRGRDGIYCEENGKKSRLYLDKCAFSGRDCGINFPN